MSSMKLAGWYFVLQAIAIGGWWLLLAVVPASRAFFLPLDFPEEALLSFLFADGVAALASARGGVEVIRGSTRCLPTVWFAAGAMVYAALYCLGALALTGGVWLPSLLMVPAAVFSVVGAWRCTKP